MPKNNMSNTCLASPVASSQLFFAWSEQAEVGMAPAVKSAPVVMTSSAVKTTSGATPARAPQATLDKVSPAASRFAPRATIQQRSSETRHKGENNCLSFTNEGRIEKVVRMGSVMIKLLKRYGITDQEIAEGVAAYARKHQQAMAS